MGWLSKENLHERRGCGENAKTEDVQNEFCREKVAIEEVEGDG
jgi:hypothetical protein